MALLGRSLKALIPAAIVALVLGASWFAPVHMPTVRLASSCSYGYGGAPNVTGISPAAGSASGGTSVTVSGCGFTGATSVQFGTAAGSNLTVVSDVQITVTSPAHAVGRVDVTVTTSLGTSATSAADQFSYNGPCASVAASVAPASAQQVGTQVTISGAASPCPNPLYEFWILYPGSSTWVRAQAYSSTSTYNWDTASLPVGSYSFIVFARDASTSGTSGNAVARWDSYATLAYSLSAPSTQYHCSSITSNAAPASPQLSGTSVTITASASGCPSPRYAFWVLAPGSSTWRAVQGYSSAGAYTWNTAGWGAGTYRWIVMARDATSFNAWDVYSLSSYTLTSIPCTGVTLSSSPSGSALAGTQVTITAVASGCPSPQYQFWLLAPGSTAWQVVQPYSAVATFAWSTGGKPAGTWVEAVWVRDASSIGSHSGGLGSWDALASATYSLTSPACASVSLSASPSATALAGTLVTITGSAGGCTNPNPLYQFWLLPPGASTWQVVQPYSTIATYPWSTGGKPAGTWTLAVWVRDANSAGTHTGALGSWDALASTTYVLTSPSCAGVSLSLSPSGSALAGTPVTISASATGCTNPSPSYKFWLRAPGSSVWQDLGPYSTGASYAWTTAGQPTGTWGVAVWVRDANSAGTHSSSLGSWDALASTTFALTPPSCTSVSIGASPSSPGGVGDTITISGAASGCTHPSPVYKYWVLYPGSQTWTLLQDYSASQSFNWRSALPDGTYRLMVMARDTASAAAWDAYATTAYTLTLCGAPENPWSYNFCSGRSGNYVYNPDPTYFCSYFNCIPSFWSNTNGYVAECNDGTYSHSGGVSGACSYHGGENRPLWG